MKKVANAYRKCANAYGKFKRKITSVVHWKAIIFGPMFAWLFLLIGIGEWNHITMDFAGYEPMANFVWVPELGMSALLCFELCFISAVCSGIIFTVTLYYITASRRKDIG